MANINTKHLATLRALIEAGFADEKSIKAIGLGEVAKLPRSCRLDLQSVIDCIEAVQSNNIISYLVATDPKTEVKDEDRKDSDV